MTALLLALALGAILAAVRVVRMDERERLHLEEMGWRRAGLGDE